MVYCGKGEADIKLPGGLSQTNRGKESSEVTVPSLLMQAIHMAIQRYRKTESMIIILKVNFKEK